MACGGFPPRLGGSPPLPLRLIITGSNPSAASAAAGHSYAHPSNWMWPILRTVGLAPSGLIAGHSDDWKLPAVAGVGFLDVGQGHSQTRVARLTAAQWEGFVPAYFGRLAAHASAAGGAAGCVCGSCGAPSTIAFAGKAQWAALFKAGGSAPPRTEYGRQDPGVRPPGWPWAVGRAAGAGTPDVWVLTSTSGAAALSNATREAPWRALAGAMGAWPRGPPACREW